MNQQAAQNVRVLAAILLRRAFLSTQENSKNMWAKLSSENREFIETKILEVIAAETDKVVIKHLADLLSEVIGSLYEIEDQIRLEEPHELCKGFIESGTQVQVIAALNIYIGMFEKLFEQFMEVREELVTVFEQTMGSDDTEISFMGLKALCKLVYQLERKDSEYFTPLLDGVMKVTMDAFGRGDEDTLEKCLIEIKTVAEAEPKFFLNKFKEICQSFELIVKKRDWDKKSIRVMPVELVSTIVCRLKTVFIKKPKICSYVVKVIYDMMVDIDEEVDDEWLNPEDGSKFEEEEFSIDPAHVGAKCIDSIIRELGASKMKPIVEKSITINRNFEKEQPWREIHANLMIFALLGEYIDNIYDAEPLVQTAVRNFFHAHPKVRYAAFHVIGQMSTDLQPAFQAHFGENLLKTMINSLEDEVPRLQAHAAASLTNFLEGATDDLVENHIKTMIDKLLKLIHKGNTLCKENAITCLATVAEAAEDQFREYYEYTIKELVPYLHEKLELKFYQFKGQLIESVVIISVSVGLEHFEPYAEELIGVLLTIQKSIFDETGVSETNHTIDKSSEHHILQSYLLTAWEKLCYLMTDKFVPYLSEIVPTLLKVASLNPEFKTEAKENLLEEVGDDTNIVSSETDEKTSALQMIEAFVTELGKGFAAYVEPASQIILPMLDYKHSETIRTTAAKCIKGLMNCVVEGYPGHRDTQIIVAEKFLETLWTASNTEQETEVLGYQCHAIRDVIKEMKTPFMSEEVVNTMCKRCIEMIHNSDKRKLINHDYTEENVHTQGENVDHQDVEIMEIENENEDEFQISISEIFGALFQTHRQYCGALCQTLFDDLLPKYLAEDSPAIKKRFSLYVIVDMIEHLEYDYIKNQFEPLVKFLLEYASCEITVLRQSALYGLGMTAIHCREAFRTYLEEAIILLKQAVEIEQGDQDKEEYLHCRDNAISSIGKIIRQYREDLNYIDTDWDELILYWIQHMPIKMDLEESKVMNQLLADLCVTKIEVILGENYIRFPMIMELLGEQLHELYMNKETIQQFGRLLTEIRLIPDIQHIFDHMMKENFGDTSFKKTGSDVCSLSDLAKKRIEKAMASGFES